MTRVGRGEDGKRRNTERENGTKLKAESREEWRKQEGRGGSCKVMRRGRLSRGVELINE